MGLSSNQVSNRRVGWDPTLLEAQNLELPQLHDSMRKQHHHNQQPEFVKCPRCDSTNTKFCYYNNYNKSQPRHFCRACKRHWTKGGTLRNVPVGGGRKNKRVKKPTTPLSTTTTTSITLTSVASLEVDHDHKGKPTSLYQPLICPQPSMDNIICTTRDSEDKDFGIGNGIFLSSSIMPHTENQSMIFPFSTTSSSFDTNPCSISTSLPSSNVYNYGEEFKTMEESTINSMMPITSGNNTPQWEIMPATGIGMGMSSNYWSWEDIDSFVSTDINVPWDDDSDVKP
ncbi:hypothetical protein TanjilG_13077 [Lupinus angustifolius]|uniref:Dof zinc finger protein n=1 Tax=Lupinus angustifolius TaxID=3871 RepID=A0A1J7GPC3_LUPAN|nr:PREDICTED: dof zinc finger protein DOF3.4-like [Lupinus angustifolius]OIV96145.1 hypothetical protein TanjilG_13077 [Lupinus angustifolius]